MDFSLIDSFIELYEALMPKTVYLVKNKGRYDEIVKAIDELKACTTSTDSNAVVDVHTDELTGSSLCLEICADVVVVDDIDKFCTALKTASSFEICPLTDGRVSIGMVFNDAYMPAPPHDASKEETK